MTSSGTCEVKFSAGRPERGGFRKNLLKCPKTSGPRRGGRELVWFRAKRREVIEVLIGDVDEGQTALVLTAMRLYTTQRPVSDTEGVPGSTSTRRELINSFQHDPLSIASFFAAHYHPCHSSRTVRKVPLPPCAKGAVRCEVGRVPLWV